MAYGDIGGQVAIGMAQQGGRFEPVIRILQKMITQREEDQKQEQKKGLMLLQHGPIAQDVYAKQTGRDATSLPGVADEYVKEAKRRLSVLKIMTEGDTIPIDSTTKALLEKAGFPDIPDKINRKMLDGFEAALAQILGGTSSGVPNPVSQPGDVINIDVP